MRKDAIMKELKAYEERRNEFYKFLDENIHKMQIQEFMISAVKLCLMPKKFMNYFIS